MGINSSSTLPDGNSSTVTRSPRIASRMRTSALSASKSASVFGTIGVRFNVAPVGVVPSLCITVTVCKPGLDAAAGWGIVDTAVAAADDVEVVGVAVAAVEVGCDDTAVAAAVVVGSDDAAVAAAVVVGSDDAAAAAIVGVGSGDAAVAAVVGSITDVIQGSGSCNSARVSGSVAAAPSSISAKASHMA
jgi:hypothetical protein